MQTYLPTSHRSPLSSVPGILALLLLGASPLFATTNVFVAVGTNGPNSSSRNFVPNVINIKAGDSVTFKAVAGGHNVTCDNPFNSGTLDPFCGSSSGAPNSTMSLNSSFTFTYLKPGDYRFYCDPHFAFNMTGVVHVASSPNPAVLTNFTILSSQPQFLIQTTIYHTNLVQASTNLTNWVTLLTNVPTTNSFLFTDQTAVSLTNRFYRVFQP